MDIEKTTLDALEKEFGSKLEPDQKEDAQAGEAKPRFEPLHNATAPQCDLKKEKYEHRLMAILKASGLSNVEIAELTGFTTPAVGLIVKQPWAEQFILEKMHGTGDKAMQRLHAAADECAKRLIDLAATAQNEECKRKANNDVLDRRYGRPNQPYTVQTKQANELADSELAKIAQGN